LIYIKLNSSEKLISVASKVSIIVRGLLHFLMIANRIYNNLNPDRNLIIELRDFKVLMYETIRGKDQN
jgi:hypothetical protein